MTRADKILVFSMAATALPVIIGILVFISPRDPARRNQTEVVLLLEKAHSDVGPDLSEHIILGDGSAILPEHEQIMHGYILTAYVKAATFTVEARPLEIGKTGLFSYIRDETGVIRFEMDGKRPNAGSRPLGQSLP